MIVFLSQESPHNFAFCHTFNGRNIFNWTMTYSKQSDFPMPYGEVVQLREHPEGEQLRQLIRRFGQANRHLAGNRTTTELGVAWLMSHCVTRGNREKVRPALKRFMRVDIYGKCYTNQTCGDSSNKSPSRREAERDPYESCKRQVARSHKFYLAFENSLCSDYVTEKFFHFLHHDIIPVTFGGADYAALAPPHSYINALDFDSVADLAAYLRQLHEDDARYAEYFWWKDYYEARDVRFSPGPICSLCRRLHQRPLGSSLYEDLPAWWLNVSRCRKLERLRGVEGRFKIGPIKEDFRSPLC